MLRPVNIYLASPFFNEEQLDRVQRVEEALAKNPTVAEVFSPRLHQFEEFEFGSKQWREATFNNDVKHILWADVIVAVHDFDDKYTDSGTAWEMGFARAYVKPVVMLQEKQGVPVNLMLAESIHAYFTSVAEIEAYDFIELVKKEYTGEVI
jgi:nucleoside 2-deoxyribosyltransferase